MAVFIPYDYDTSGPFADQVEVSDTPTHSKLLGPDGKPLKYETQSLGFDLRRKGNAD